MSVENVVEMAPLVKKRKVVWMKMLVTMTLMQLKTTIHVTSVERDVKAMVVVSQQLTH